jgi:hypothetical protein
LQYARASFGPFASCHISDIQRLMGCLLWAGRLEVSPYSDLLAPSHWDTVTLEFTRECCNLLGQAYESPLQVTVSAGSQALPTLIKLATVMANKKQVSFLKPLCCSYVSVDFNLEVSDLSPHGSQVWSLWQDPYQCIHL